MSEQRVSTLASTHRAQAILRAVAAGRVRMTLSCEPDLFVDGLACCDQATAHWLHRTGLVRPAAPGRIGDLVPAKLTAAGAEILHGSPTAA